MTEKLIITVALSGGQTKKEANPAVPYEPAEFAEEAYLAMNEGASIVHIHAKESKTGNGTMDVQRLRDTIGAIKERCPELIINMSTGSPFDTAEDRIAPVIDMKPDMASFNTNSMNVGAVNHKTGEIYGESIYEDTCQTMAYFAEEMKNNGVKPEFEIFDPGGLYNTMIVAKQKDYFDLPMNFQLIYGVLGGMTYNPLLHMSLVNMLPEGSNYSVCGVGPWQTKIAMLATITGGHIRVGLEDNIRMPDKELAKGNWEQVTWVKQLAQIADRPVATPAESREILGLK
ncbi:MAG: 3-keto-5-aminohexanoate cleavage protein [Deltaproteobacteria bacterium]|nr:3-keto-5-aminohexanoate cleavage protein [Deltaproteobacteria bacterium]